MKKIRQTLVFAFGYNALGIPVAAGVLYPAFGLLMSPVFAGVNALQECTSTILDQIFNRLVDVHQNAARAHS